MHLVSRRRGIHRDRRPGMPPQSSAAWTAALVAVVAAGCALALISSMGSMSMGVAPPTFAKAARHKKKAHGGGGIARRTDIKAAGLTHDGTAFHEQDLPRPFLDWPEMTIAVRPSAPRPPTKSSSSTLSMMPVGPTARGPRGMAGANDTRPRPRCAGEHQPGGSVRLAEPKPGAELLVGAGQR